MSSHRINRTIDRAVWKDVTMRPEDKVKDQMYLSKQRCHPEIQARQEGQSRIMMGVDRNVNQMGSHTQKQNSSTYYVGWSSHQN